nr:hypothetical protein Iba_chr06aCG9860 [Ipomoea batatas]
MLEEEEAAEIAVSKARQFADNQIHGIFLDSKVKVANPGGFNNGKGQVWRRYQSSLNLDTAVFGAARSNGLKSKALVTKGFGPNSQKFPSFTPRELLVGHGPQYLYQQRVEIFVPGANVFGLGQWEQQKGWLREQARAVMMDLKLGLSLNVAPWLITVGANTHGRQFQSLQLLLAGAVGMILANDEYFGKREIEADEHFLPANTCHPTSE